MSELLINFIIENKNIHGKTINTPSDYLHVYSLYEDCLILKEITKLYYSYDYITYIHSFVSEVDVNYIMNKYKNKNYITLSYKSIYHDDELSLVYAFYIDKFYIYYNSTEVYRDINALYNINLI